MPSLEERFYAKVSPEPNTGCHIWTGSVSRTGYGRFNLGGLLKNAHRVAWMLDGRGDPGSLNVLHKCDNPGCVNPEHLFLGTQAENMADAARKGRCFAQVHPERMPRGDLHHLRLHPERAARGERNGTAKLAEADIFAIRARLAAGDFHHVIARQFGVSRTTISLIAERRIWAHVA